MVAVVVSVAMGVMNTLLPKLMQMLEEKYNLVKGVRKDIIFLESELRAMQGVLEVMADAEELDPLDMSWRDMVREMSYDIEDCIDLSVQRLSPTDAVTNKGLVAKLTGKVSKLRMSHKIAVDIQELKARVLAESERRKRYTLDLPSNSDAPVKVDPRMCSLWVEAERLVGIDGPRDKIIGWLMPERSEELAPQVTTLSIVGCAGLGKTTLAKQVYLQIKGEFKCKAFVPVSQRPIIKDVLKDICSQVGATTPGLVTEQNLIDSLIEYLQHKRYCIVVDDIWESEPWKFIGAALVKTSPGSVIIITTRMKDVAESCRFSHGGRVHQMDHLGDSDSKRLFFIRIFGSEEKCPPELVQISKEIVSKCDGIPLAITSISSFLASDVPPSAHPWKTVKERISAQVSESKCLETMQSVLALSYFNLPHYLRSCLLYLSAFPEDCEIDRDRLVSRWIAEGFISAGRGETLYEAGVRYFNMLINRSLIQPWREHNGEVLSCRVHDVILDFIVVKSVEENFVTLTVPSGLSPPPAASKVRRLSVHGRFQEGVVVPWKNIKPHVRSLVSSDVDCNDLHPLSEFEVLRVLDLEGCGSLENNHLDNIQKLVQLRYLGIRRTRVSELPAGIGQAHLLETLDIRDAQVKELPSGIVLLQRLVRLLVDSNVKFPAEGVSKMKALEELSQFCISMQPLSFLKELGELTKLRVLGVIWSRWHPEETVDEHRILNIFASSLGVLGSHNLCSLDLELCESACNTDPLPLFPDMKTLQKFRTWGHRPNFDVSNWIGSLVNLEHLELNTSITQDDLRGMSALEALSLGHVPDGFVISSSDGLQRLKFLRIEYGNLVFMPGSAPNLKDLRMRLDLGEAGCDDSGIQHLPSLTKVHVYIVGRRRNHSSVDRKEAQLRSIVDAHPNRPVLSIERLVRKH